jgi:hypothetical protein
MQKTKDDMRQALRQAIAGLESQEPVAHCEAGPNYCWKCLEESKPTYGSEEIAKLREVNKSLVKNIEELKKEPPPFWPVVQHLLDEYGLQFIDVVAAYREATQPEQEPVQVSPLEFVEMVMEKEHLIGKPIFWAEWPNKEKNT